MALGILVIGRIILGLKYYRAIRNDVKDYINLLVRKQ
jgi:hypothetical protein